MRKRINYSDEELLEILRKTYEEKGFIKCEDFRVKYNKPHYQIYIKRFGNWENAKILANIPTKEKRIDIGSKEDLIKCFIEIVDENQKLPTLRELDLNLSMPSTRIIYKYFENYDELIKECGFEKITTDKGKYKEEFLLNEIRRFVKEFGRVPQQGDFERLEGYPSRKTFTNHFGKFNDAIKLAGFEPISLNMRDQIERVKERSKKETISKWIHDFIEKYEKVPTRDEIDKELGFCIKDYIKKAYGTWNSCLIELGLQLNSVSQYTDEFLHSEFERFVRDNGRIPKMYEFNNSEYPSFWCYQQRFGSWRDTIRYYGYEAIFDNCNFENISDKLIILCNEIFEKENRRILCINDINKCEYLPNYCCCMKHMKLNNYTVRKLLKENGFEFCKGSTGMVHEFEDGEITVSSYEFKFSKMLRDNGFKYNENFFRNVKYKNFIIGYENNMNCDYLIIINNKEIYVEIAGYLRDYKRFYYNNTPINTNKRKEEYRQKLMQKEQMLKDNNLEYHILFPSDLQEDFIMQIFNKEAI